MPPKPPTPDDPDPQEPHVPADAARTLDYERPVLPFERKAEPMGAWGWASVGVEFGLIVVLFFLGGRWLDGRLGATPWLTLTGSLLGVAAGMFLLIRSALRGQLPSSQPPSPPGRPAPPPGDRPDSE